MEEDNRIVLRLARDTGSNSTDEKWQVLSLSDHGTLCKFGKRARSGKGKKVVGQKQKIALTISKSSTAVIQSSKRKGRQKTKIKKTVTSATTVVNDASELAHGDSTQSDAQQTDVFSANCRNFCGSSGVQKRGAVTRRRRTAAVIHNDNHAQKENLIEADDFKNMNKTNDITNNVDSAGTVATDHCNVAMDSESALIQKDGIPVRKDNCPKGSRLNGTFPVTDESLKTSRRRKVMPELKTTQTTKHRCRVKARVSEIKDAKTETEAGETVDVASSSESNTLSSDVIFCGILTSRRSRPVKNRRLMDSCFVYDHTVRVRRSRKSAKKQPTAEAVVNAECMITESSESNSVQLQGISDAGDLATLVDDKLNSPVPESKESLTCTLHECDVYEKCDLPSDLHALCSPKDTGEDASQFDEDGDACMPKLSPQMSISASEDTQILPEQDYMNVTEVEGNGWMVADDRKYDMPCDGANKDILSAESNSPLLKRMHSYVEDGSVDRWQLPSASDNSCYRFDHFGKSDDPLLAARPAETHEIEPVAPILCRASSDSCITDNSTTETEPRHSEMYDTSTNYSDGLSCMPGLNDNTAETCEVEPILSIAINNDFYTADNSMPEIQPTASEMYDTSTNYSDELSCMHDLYENTAETRKTEPVLSSAIHNDSCTADKSTTEIQPTAIEMYDASTNSCDGLSCMLDTNENTAETCKIEPVLSSVLNDPCATDNSATDVRPMDSEMHNASTNFSDGFSCLPDTNENSGSDMGAGMGADTDMFTMAGELDSLPAENAEDSEVYMDVSNDVMDSASAVINSAFVEAEVIISCDTVTTELSNDVGVDDVLPLCESVNSAELNNTFDAEPSLSGSVDHDGCHNLCCGEIITTNTDHETMNHSSPQAVVHSSGSESKISLKRSAASHCRRNTAHRSHRARRKTVSESTGVGFYHNSTENSVELLNATVCSEENCEEMPAADHNVGSDVVIFTDAKYQVTDQSIDLPDIFTNTSAESCLPAKRTLPVCRRRRNSDRSHTACRKIVTENAETDLCCNLAEKSAELLNVTVCSEENREVLPVADRSAESDIIVAKSQIADKDISLPGTSTNTSSQSILPARRIVTICIRRKNLDKSPGDPQKTVRENVEMDFRDNISEENSAVSLNVTVCSAENREERLVADQNLNSNLEIAAGAESRIIHQSTDLPDASTSTLTEATLPARITASSRHRKSADTSHRARRKRVTKNGQTDLRSNLAEKSAELVNVTVCSEEIHEELLAADGSVENDIIIAKTQTVDQSTDLPDATTDTFTESSLPAISCRRRRNSHRTRLKTESGNVAEDICHGLSESAGCIGVSDEKCAKRIHRASGHSDKNSKHTLDELSRLCSKIKQSLSVDDMDIGSCLVAMSMLAKLPVTSHILAKNADILVTIKKCRKFKGSEAVRRQAALIYDKFKTVFHLPSDVVSNHGDGHADATLVDSQHHSSSDGRSLTSSRHHTSVGNKSTKTKVEQHHRIKTEPATSFRAGSDGCVQVSSDSCGVLVDKGAAAAVPELCSSTSRRTPDCATDGVNTPASSKSPGGSVDKTVDVKARGSDAKTVAKVHETDNGLLDSSADVKTASGKRQNFAGGGVPARDNHNPRDRKLIPENTSSQTVGDSTAGEVLPRDESRGSEVAVKRRRRISAKRSALYHRLLSFEAAGSSDVDASSDIFDVQSLSSDDADSDDSDVNLSDHSRLNPSDSELEDRITKIIAEEDEEIIQRHCFNYHSSPPMPHVAASKPARRPVTVAASRVCDTTDCSLSVAADAGASDIDDDELHQMLGVD